MQIKDKQYDMAAIGAPAFIVIMIILFCTCGSSNSNNYYPVQQAGYYD